MSKDIGITTDKENNENQFAYLNNTNYTGMNHLIHDRLPDKYDAVSDGHVIKWVAKAGEEDLDVMFGFPDVDIHDLKVYPTDEDLTQVPDGGIAGAENEDPTNPMMVWKSVDYKNDNSVDVTLNFFQKQVNLKLDFIYLIDETGTMGSTVSANGFSQSQALWARFAALKGSEGIFGINSNYPGYGMNNRVRFISWNNAGTKDSGFLTDFNVAKTWVSSYAVLGGGTDHSVAINAAINACEQSRAAGQRPIVVYLSDYHAAFDSLSDTTINRLKAKAESIYPFLIFDSYGDVRQTRMNRLAPKPFHTFTRAHDDPSTLVTPVVGLVRDAISRCSVNMIIQDVFANGLAVGADENGITSTGAGTNAVTYNASNDTAQWKLVDDSVEDSRLFTGSMYTKVIHVPMTDAVYSGSMPTNGDLVLKDGDAEVNQIEEENSPLLEKGMTLVNKEKLNGQNGHTGPNLTGTFKLYSGTAHGESDTPVWTGTATGGSVVIPWAAADGDGNVAFPANSTYTLVQTSVADGDSDPGDNPVLPDGYWTISVDSNYVITATPHSDHPQSEDRVLAAGYYDGKMEIYDDIEPAVHYVLAGGSWSHGGNDEPVVFDLSETHHTFTVTSDIPVREGYIFKGWLATDTAHDYIDGNIYHGGDTISFYRHTDNDDVTLTAQWVEGVNIVVHILQKTSSSNINQDNAWRTENAFIQLEKNDSITAAAALTAAMGFIKDDAIYTGTRLVKDSVSSSYLYGMSGSTEVLLADSQSMTYDGTDVKIGTNVLNPAELNLVLIFGHNLTVTKEVAGAMGDTTREFTIYVSSDALTANDVYEDTETTPGTYPVDEQKRITLALSHGESITLKELPEGTYTITEEATGSSYEVKYSIDDGAESDTCSFTLDADKSVTVKNTLDNIAPTGVKSFSKAFLLLLMAGVIIAAGTILIMRRRRA